MREVLFVACQRLKSYTIVRRLAWDDISELLTVDKVSYWYVCSSQSSGHSRHTSLEMVRQKRIDGAPPDEVNGALHMSAECQACFLACSLRVALMRLFHVRPLLLPLKLLLDTESAGWLVDSLDLIAIGLGTGFDTDIGLAAAVVPDDYLAHVGSAVDRSSNCRVVFRRRLTTK